MEDVGGWRPVVGYEGRYVVSADGRVMSVGKGLLLRARSKSRRCSRHRGSDKYLMVELSLNGISKRFFVHKLVLTAFVGPRQEGQECRHLDGDIYNNDLSNLAWGSYRENRADWHKHRKKIKLTPDLVRYIRGSTKSLRALAGELGVCRSTVQYARGGYWADVPSPALAQERLPGTGTFLGSEPYLVF